EKIGQTSWAVTLGGLRTLVATFTYLKAYDQFASQHWNDLEKTFETTVQLSPHSRYYWDLGAWHMSYNAGSYYLSESDLPPIRARAERLRWIHKGRAFLEKGIQNNPRDPQIRLSLARFYEDSFQIPDDQAACAQYEKAMELGADQTYVQRAYLRSLVRTGQDPARARALLADLLKTRENRVPTLLCFDFVFRWEDLSGKGTPDPVALAVQEFGSESKALLILGSFLTDVRSRWPSSGVETTVRVLESRAGISPADPRSDIYKRDQAMKGVIQMQETGVVPGQRRPVELAPQQH
ncbi:MAG: hypothetical protein JWO82_9, partial [Akkermansiaceae bacterium]|nr:hypothetical protein [Akkermansiaceae bacterium]